MIFVFAPAEIEDQDIICRHQEMLLAGAHVIDMQRIGRRPTVGEKIKPPPVGAELLAFKIAELVLGVVAASLQQEPIIVAVRTDAS